MKIGLIVIIFFGLIMISQSTLDLDFSNLDLKNFQFFKFFPSMMQRATSNILPPIEEHFQKKKAVLVYARNVILGNPEHDKPTEIKFDPYFGESWRPQFENHFGRRGERLIEYLGRGHSVGITKIQPTAPKNSDYHY